MPLTGVLKQVSSRKCPHCKDEYGDHSKKQFLRCLYTSDYNFYELATKYNQLVEKYNQLEEKVKAEEKVDKESKSPKEEKS